MDDLSYDIPHQFVRTQIMSELRSKEAHMTDVVLVNPVTAMRIRRASLHRSSLYKRTPFCGQSDS